MGPAPLRALRLPRRGTGGGETPAGRNPRRRKPPPEANPPPNSRSGGAARDHRGEQAGERPRRRVEARPPGPGGPGAGAGGPEPKRGSAGRPPAGGATGPGPHKGAGDRCPGVRKRARPHLAGPGRIPKIVCGTLAARKRSAEGWGGCAPTVGPAGPGPNAAPVSGHDGRTGEAGEERGPGEGPRRTRIRAAWRPGDLSRRARGPGGLAALPRGRQSPRTARRGQERAGRTVHAALTMRASEGRRRSRRAVPRSAVGGPGCTAENLPKCHGPLPGPPLLDNRTLFHQYF